MWELRGASRKELKLTLDLERQTLTKDQVLVSPMKSGGRGRKPVGVRSEGAPTI